MNDKLTLAMSRWITREDIGPGITKWCPTCEAFTRSWMDGPCEYCTVCEPPHSIGWTA